MLPGKVPPGLLERIVFTNLGREDPDVVLGPGLGQDAAVIRIGTGVLIAASDPITGSVEDVGYLAVHVNANDIATFGIPPRWFLSSILLPRGATPDELKRIMGQIDSAAASLGVSVVGGHTEVTDRTGQPVVAGFMLGFSESGEYVTSAGARPGDAIVMTKTVAIEGTAILATEGWDYLQAHIHEDVLSQATAMRGLISVVKEGVVAFKTGHVTAMHDPTEGGLAGALHELCDASSVGCMVDARSIPVHSATRAICSVLGIDPMQLISSGCMLLTCDAGHADRVVSSIGAAGVRATIIGRTVSDPGTRRVVDDHGERPLPRPETDALWAALEMLSRP